MPGVGYTAQASLHARRHCPVTSTATTRQPSHCTSKTRCCALTLPVCSSGVQNSRGAPGCCPTKCLLCKSRLGGGQCYILTEVHTGHEYRPALRLCTVDKYTQQHTPNLSVMKQTHTHTHACAAGRVPDTPAPRSTAELWSTGPPIPAQQGQQMAGPMRRRDGVDNTLLLLSCRAAPASAGA